MFEPKCVSFVAARMGVLCSCECVVKHNVLLSTICSLIITHSVVLCMQHACKNLSLSVHYDTDMAVLQHWLL